MGGHDKCERCTEVRLRGKYSWYCCQCGDENVPCKPDCPSCVGSQDVDSTALDGQTAQANTDTPSDKGAGIDNDSTHQSEGTARTYSVSYYTDHSNECNSSHDIRHETEREDDCRSIQSADSSTTFISTLSGLTVVEIEGATMALQRVFQDDARLVGLYQRAIDDASIGPRRLQRNLERLLRMMARDLKAEAEKEIEILTSRFVSMKARYVAHCIVEESFNKPAAMQPLRPQELKEGSEDEHELREQPEGDGPEQLQPIDEDRFEDLAVFQTFLTQSAAFQTFRDRLALFVIPKETRLHTIESQRKSPETKLSTQRYQTSLDRVLRWISLVCKTVFMEPPLSPNTVRLRWQCKCGEKFRSDVQEYRPGGISRLTKRMQRSGCLNAAINTHEPGDSVLRYTIRCPAWLQRAKKRFFFKMVWPSNNSMYLPQYQPSSISRTSTLKSSSIAPHGELFLMACMHRTQHHVNVVQDILQEITTDRQLFCFLRMQVRRHRNVFSNILSLKRVQGIFFVKFRLRKGGVAEVRHHQTCCTQHNCECIPPQIKVIKPPMGSGEYDCNPSGPPDTWPPVCPEFMMHMLYSPGCIAEDDTSILEQLPKKMHCKLDEAKGPPPEGWRLYFQEETDISTMIGFVFVVLFLASLLFLVVWTMLEDDIQGASGVSAYIVAVASMIGIWIAAKCKSFG